MTSPTGPCGDALSDLQGGISEPLPNCYIERDPFEIKLLVPKKLCCWCVFQNYNLTSQGEAQLYSVRSAHFCPHEGQVSRELHGSAGLLLPSWTQVIRLLSPLPVFSQDVGSEAASYASSLWQERQLLVSSLPPQAFTPAKPLMFYRFLFKSVLKELTQLIQTPSSKSHSGVAALVVFHSPNESNCILMTVDPIKQHLIGLFPGISSSLFSSSLLSKKFDKGAVRSCCQALLDFP